MNIPEQCSFDAGDWPRETKPVASSGVARNIRLLAETLDSQGKTDAPIRVASSRDYLRRFFKAPKRGQPLVCGTHEIEIL